MTLTDLGTGSAKVLCNATNASVGSGVIQLRVTDGGLSTEVDLPYQVVAGGGYTVSGLPSALNANQGDAVSLYDLHASPMGAATNASTNTVTWTISGIPTNLAQITSLGPLDAQLSVSPVASGQGTLTVQATCGTNSGTASSTFGVGTNGFRFVNFPYSVQFADNAQSLTIPLLATGGTPGAAPIWSVPASATNWATFLSQNGLSAVIRVNRSGFGASTNLPVTISDGIASNTGTISLYEQAGTPNFVLATTNFSGVAGTPDSSYLITAADPNLTDTLTWSLVNAPSWASIVPIPNSRSAYLVISNGASRSNAPVTIQVSNGSTNSTQTVSVTTSSGAVSLSGPSGPLVLQQGSGLQTFDYTLNDPNAGLIDSISVVGSGAWLSWWWTGNKSVRVSVDATTTFSGQFSVIGSNAFTQSSLTVPVRVTNASPIPSIQGLPSSITLPLDSKPVTLPFSLFDANTNASLSVGLTFPISGVQVTQTGPLAGVLQINPVQTNSSYPIVLNVTDGTNSSSTTVQVNLGSTNPDSFDIVSAEFFVDTDPGKGNGIPVPPTSNEAFPDCASYARAYAVANGLATGWHKVGFRVRTSAGAWSAIQYLDFYAFGDQALQLTAGTTTNGETFFST